MTPPLFKEGDRVTACDCLMTGRISRVWKSQPSTLNPQLFYRVQFPPRSPFIDDWAVYREHELAEIIEKLKLTNLNIVDAMRPKLPKP